VNPKFYFIQGFTYDRTAYIENIWENITNMRN